MELGHLFTRSGLTHPEVSSKVLLCGSETWTIKGSDARRITAAEMKYTRRTAGYTWTDYKTNAQIAKELKITPILDKIWEFQPPGNLWVRNKSVQGLLYLALLLLLLPSLSSHLCRVFILIFLRQTMSLGNTVLQLSVVTMHGVYIVSCSVESIVLLN